MKNVSKGQELYRLAKNLIPGGTMLLSNDQKCLFQIYGPLIFLKLRAVKFGI